MDGVHHRDGVGEVLVRFAVWKIGAVGALVFDDDLALAEHPVGQKGVSGTKSATPGRTGGFGAGTRSCVLPCRRKVLPRRARMPCASVRAHSG